VHSVIINKNVANIARLGKHKLDGIAPDRPILHENDASSALAGFLLSLVVP